ncbi:MAG: terminase small subunit [Clostridia bacterium]|nr:terminase small subunit [Clostridia bacterium]
MAELSSKEKLFCTYYSLGRSAKEAAAKSGYVFPEKSGLKLLRKESIKKEIERNVQQRRSEQKNISEGYYRLAFGCISDAIKLIFSDDVDIGQIEQMDLFNIAEIKKKKGGDIEVKFFDRLKALEKLHSLNTATENDGNSFYSAIEKGASALREHEIEQP